MSKLFVKATSLLLAAALLFSVGAVPVFASDGEGDEDDVYVEYTESGETDDGCRYVITDSSIHLEYDGRIDDIVIEDEYNGIQTVRIQSEVTEEEGYFSYNAEEETFYSSYTGEEISLADELTVVGDEVEGSKVSYSYKYIPYSTIKRILGGSSVLSHIIAVIASLTGATTPGRVLSEISYALGKIQGTTADSSSHGLRLTIKTTKYYRTRLGRKQVYKTTRMITAVSTY